MKQLAFIGFVIFSLFLFYAASELRDFGEPPSDMSTILPGTEYDITMDDRIIGSYNETTETWDYGAVKETGANNVVTSVVFDYRGYDTLGEATVLFTAIAGVMLLLGGKKDE
jgi:hypothetical protein